MIPTKPETLARHITEENESVVIKALREYYRREYRNGHSDEAFIVWVEGMIDGGEE